MSDAKRDYEVRILAGSRRLDPQRDNVDVEVRFSDGRRYAATFFTLENIRRLFEENQRSGECGGGLYFWASDMILVKKLTEATIEQTVANLIETGELDAAFAGPFTDD